MVCGETEVAASRLRMATDQLNELEEASGISGFQKHYQVHPIHIGICTLYRDVDFEGLFTVFLPDSGGHKPPTQSQLH